MTPGIAGSACAAEHPASAAACINLLFIVLLSLAPSMSWSDRPNVGKLSSSAFYSSRFTRKDFGPFKCPFQGGPSAPPGVVILRPFALFSPYGDAFAACSVHCPLLLLWDYGVKAIEAGARIDGPPLALGEFSLESFGRAAMGSERKKSSSPNRVISMS